MTDLREQLTPFYGKFCTYQAPERSQQLMRALGLTVSDDGALRLYVFDWKGVDDDLKDEIREAAGQDDYRIFAVVNPAVATPELADVARGGNQGFLMYSSKTQKQIYLGNGEMDTFTEDIGGFVAGLSSPGG